ncbi:NAD-dependent epimerase/dehydratase family protein [Ligilactobacillus ceti]|uniref:Udp-glucose 4-epimerase n=1 Tax=Ligilactobacillus ceti DSM 22408 TaxID=1122146 RepID=A0A0R2KGD2_9LACO|nr:NAD-dependent epimerase/dehydratase family protein [Ligilactobacillus ceti]KRN88431.1 udp-glucose 4-epimerase [Ligilactobacillus ceti DSM 22408]
MNKYLVTGGAGFVGSNLVQELIKDGNEVVIVDDLSMGDLNNLKNVDSNKYTFYQRSITDKQFMEELLVKENFDYIVLLAAVASVADSIERPYETHLINQEANIDIIEAVRKNKLTPKKVYFASSAAVYGDEPTLPKKETSQIKPLTPYAIDKFASERYLITYGKLYNIPTVTTRFFNVYGPNQNPSSPYSGVLSIIQDKLQKNTEFTLFGDGEQTRDFVYVKDVIQAIRILLEDERAVYDVYNVATGTSESLINVIHHFEKNMNKELQIQYYPARVGDIKYSAADISKLKALGYQPEYDLARGLKDYITHS